MNPGRVPTHQARKRAPKGANYADHNSRARMRHSIAHRAGTFSAQAMKRCGQCGCGQTSAAPRPPRSASPSTCSATRPGEPRASQRRSQIQGWAPTPCPTHHNTATQEGPNRRQGSRPCCEQGRADGAGHVCQHVGGGHIVHNGPLGCCRHACFPRAVKTRTRATAMRSRPGGCGAPAAVGAEPAAPGCAAPGGALTAWRAAAAAAPAGPWACPRPRCAASR
jgi:hypothetical protein